MSTPVTQKTFLERGFKPEHGVFGMLHMLSHDLPDGGGVLAAHGIDKLILIIDADAARHRLRALIDVLAYRQIFEQALQEVADKRQQDVIRIAGDHPVEIQLGHTLLPAFVFVGGFVVIDGDQLVQLLETFGVDIADGTDGDQRLQRFAQGINIADR